MVLSNFRPTVLVTDLDNTLWDWFHAWHRSFSVMLEEVSRLSGVSVPVLEAEIRKVHQDRGTTEYSFLLDEVPSLVVAAGDRTPLDAYDAAVKSLHSARRRHTTLYSGVRETLDELRARGILIVAYTESIAYWTEWRIKHTGLDGIIDILYSSPDHSAPKGRRVEDLRMRPESEYGLRETRHLHVPSGTRKPNAAVLRSILEDCHVGPEEAVYVGDSLMKDIAMAQDAGVFDVHAEYGLADRRPEYALLQRVSHWPESDVEREKVIAANPDVHPSLVLRESFAEVLQVFDSARTVDAST